MKDTKCNALYYNIMITNIFIGGAHTCAPHSLTHFNLLTHSLTYSLTQGEVGIVVICNIVISFFTCFSSLSNRRPQVGPSLTHSLTHPPTTHSQALTEWHVSPCRYEIFVTSVVTTRQSCPPIITL